MLPCEPLKIWWSKGPEPGNFGDILTPYLLQYFGIPHKWTSKKDAAAISIGSIAKFAKKGTLVIGSGTMRASDPLDPLATWWFVRGPHTREIVLRGGGSCPEIYGDPALLLPKLQPPSPKKYKIGFTPHYVDYQEVKERYPAEKVINLLNSNPLEVAKEISQCETVISSSLHGIIAAHSYGIPCAWVRYSDKLSGDGIKFKDHYASVGLECPDSSLSDPPFLLPKEINTDIIEKRISELCNQQL